MEEVDKIKERYDKRLVDGKILNQISASLFSVFVTTEREKYYTSILDKKFNNIQSLNFLEIGAGEGSNIPFFNNIGIELKNIYANELLENRSQKLKENFPNINHLSGDALKIDDAKQFDIVFQSTVFTSILDDDFKKLLANKMMTLTKPNGIILWYDFVYDNPKNKDVKGVPKNEIINLFPNAKKISFKRVTLAPPIGRRVGKLYPIINGLFPFLRSHIIAVIEK